MRQDGFNQKKACILKNINTKNSDLSPKGSIDELCSPIISLINSHNDMVTTSSCSGRVSIFVEGDKKKNERISKLGGKGEGGRWLFVTHEMNDIFNWTEKVQECILWENRPDPSLITADSRLVLYKFEPFILHVKCRDFATASKLLKTAMYCGFRESGIGSNHLVAIRIRIELNVPIGNLDTNANRIIMFVDQGYIRLIDKLALTKFKENERKMSELYSAIKNNIVDVDYKPEIKTKESKKERVE